MQERVGRVEALLEQVESLTDPRAKAAAVETVQALLELYREGLSRLMERLEQLGGRALCEAAAEDDLVAHLLFLHDLHPVDVRTRVLRALEEVRPTLLLHSGDVELLDIENGVARLRLQGSCHGCPASAMTLKLAIEEAVLKAAPDLERIEAEGVADSGAGPGGAAPAAPFSPLRPLPMYTECPTQFQHATAGRADEVALGRGGR